MSKTTFRYQMGALIAAMFFAKILPVFNDSAVGNFRLQINKSIENWAIRVTSWSLVIWTAPFSIT